MSWMHSRLLGVAVILFLLLAGAFISYQFNRENRLHMIALQNELQGLNDRVYDLFEFKFDGMYNDSCLYELPSLLDAYEGVPLRITIISVKDGSVLFDTFDDGAFKHENHFNRPEVVEAYSSGVGYDRRESTLPSHSDCIYSATYRKASDFIVRTSVASDVRLADIYPSDRFILWFEIAITLVFIVFIYNVLRRMGSSQLAKEKLLAHLRISQEGLAVFDKNRRLIFANKLFSRYGDLISSKYLTDTAEIIYQPEFYNVRMFLDRNSEAQHLAEPCFSDKIEKDGRTYSVQCFRFTDRSFEISINDVTQSEAQSQLKQQLTQNVAHEFKTPVCSIQGYLETILANYPHNLSEEQLNHFLSRCYSQSTRLKNLVQDMSQLIEISGNSPYIEKEMFNLAAVVRGLVGEISDKLTAQHITVLNELPEVLLVNGNSSMLYSVFRNLFENAITYAGGGCTIKLNCYRSDSEYYYFSFSDNGAGVDDEHLNRLFERFYRVDKGRSRKLGGTGLGLAIVKNAVILHGGTISARHNDGGGLEFVFTIRR